MPAKPKTATPAESRKCQASKADEQPVNQNRHGAQKDNEDEDDNEEAAAANEWANLEDQATKTKGKGGRGGNRGRAAPKYVSPSSMVSMMIAIDWGRSPPHIHLHSPLPQEDTCWKADKTDDGRLANETNKEVTHDTNANEQNDDPEKEGDTKQAESDEDEETTPRRTTSGTETPTPTEGDTKQAETDEDEELNNDDQHAEQDNQQDNAEVNDQQDRNPDPNLNTGLATRQCALHTTATKTTTTTRPQATLTNPGTNIAMRHHATPTSVKGTIPGKGNANTKTTAADVACQWSIRACHVNGELPTNNDADDNDNNGAAKKGNAGGTRKKGNGGSAYKRDRRPHNDGQHHHHAATTRPHHPPPTNDHPPPKNDHPPPTNNDRPVPTNNNPARTNWNRHPRATTPRCDYDHYHRPIP
ncbi:hypothetical protein K443DRAFT_11218 [Laccaria amethystina LaAM-08-1]|uniref:Uncharacterized protein n=1 Tax=Laccaria amethystina LaAM-08-1 TaxID=1095629 RepID=A0A0C9X327_9AGAR|nr:hypothetical protein K443DRAFT_11218 [Laccaria amethystina LaAM-08-1]